MSNGRSTLLGCLAPVPVCAAGCSGLPPANNRLRKKSRARGAAVVALRGDDGGVEPLRLEAPRFEPLNAAQAREAVELIAALLVAASDRRASRLGRRAHRCTTHAAHEIGERRN